MHLTLYLHMILLREYQLYLRWGQTKPLCVDIHWKTHNIKCDYLAGDGYYSGLDGKETLPYVSLLADSAHIKVLLSI